MRFGPSWNSYPSVPDVWNGTAKVNFGAGRLAGHIAADYLRTKHPGLPVLVVAGFMDDDRIRAQNPIREFHTFPAPFGPVELLTKIKSVLEYERERTAH